MIKRDFYLNRMIHHMWNGEVKVITGIRRCGKSASGVCILLCPQQRETLAYD